MNTVVSTKKLLMVAILAMSLTTVDAHRRPLRHRIIHSTTVVAKPVVAEKNVNRFDRNGRLSMALAYIDKHNHITAKAYAKITGLSKASAEAELDSFVRSHKTPIKAVMNGKKTVYVRA